MIMRRAITVLLAALALCTCASPPGSLGFDARARDAARDAPSAADAPADATAQPLDARVDPPDSATPPADFDPALWEGSVIYFVLTDRFANGDPSNDGDDGCTDPASPTLYHGGDFRGLSDHLDYIEELGADAVWITPVPEQIGCGYHGYWADLDDPYDGRIEPRLGGEAGLTALIDALHAREMRLVVDHVVNHSGRRARLTTTHPEWLHPDRPACESLGDPEVMCPLSGLPDLAHERDDVAAYMDALSIDFVRRFDFDGIRIDTVKHVAPEYFREHWVPAVHGARPSLYLLGEIFDEGGYGLHDRYLETGIHGHFDFPLRRAIIASLAQGGSIDGVARRVQEAVTRFGIERARLRSLFLDNHDVPRFLVEMGSRPDDERRARYHLALAVILTTPGIPQILYGDELGMSGNYPENRRDMPAWAWAEETRGGTPVGYLPDPARTHEWTRRLIALRSEIPALSHGDYAELWRPGGSGVELWAFVRAHDDSHVVVAFNAGATTLTDRSTRLRDNPGVAPTTAAAFPDGAVLVDRLGEGRGTSARIEGGRLLVTLPPRSVAIFTPR